MSFQLQSQVTEVLPLTLPPFYITTDYNLDGQEELVYTDADTVHIVTRQGFITTSLFEFVLDNPGNIRAGDINGDGFPELTLVNFNEVRLLENNNGVPGQVNLIETSTWRHFQWTEIFDFDMDGDGDLLQNESDLAIYVIENANGTFLTDEKIFITNTNKKGGQTDAHFCDFNQDGFIDPLLYQIYTGLIIIYNQGDGNFTVNQNFSVPYPAGLDTDDYNGDGFPDLFQLRRAFGQQDALTLRVSTNPYGGSPAFYSTPLAGQPNGIDAIDVNQDMIPDVILADQHSVSVLYSNLVQYEYQLIWGEPDTTEFTHPLPLVKVDVLDLDADGFLEIIHVNKDGQGRILTTDWVSSGPEYSCLEIPDPLDCPQGDIVMTRQSEVDSFLLLYPNCTIVHGSLTLTGDITDLSPLRNIVSIGGALAIEQTQLQTTQGWGPFFIKGEVEILNNSNLDQLVFDQLYKVEGEMVVMDNLPLTFMSFDKLYSIDGGLYLAGHPALQELNTFEELGTVAWIEIANHDQLKTIYGFNWDFFSVRRVMLTDNPELDTVDGFDTYDTGLTLVIDGCPLNSLKTNASIDTLHVRNVWMDSISPYQRMYPLFFVLENVSGLTSVEGLDSFGLYDLAILGCPDIEQLASGITIRGLDLRHNPILNDLSGIVMPFGGMQNLKLIDNASLVSLHSLPVLSRIDKVLQIEGNTALESIGSLNVTSIFDVDSLIVVNNPQLGICDAEPVCMYIAQYDTYRIENNASGCQSHSQVETACNNVPPFNPPVWTDDAKPEPYPNPADDKIWIPSDDLPQSVRLYDQTGRLIEELVSEKEMNISQIPIGFYTLVVSNASRLETYKICIAR